MSRRFLCVLWGIAILATASRVHEASAQTRPVFALVAQSIEAHFASQIGYQPGDLICRSQIDQVLTRLANEGMPIPAKDIAALGLDDSCFLVRELASPSGQKFMRKVARTPGAFAKLDRLSTIPRGESLVRDLIHQKDGDKLIEYLATTKGGQRMGDMMGGVRGGVDLNRPTSRIYTVEDLLAVLRAACAKK